MKMFKQPSFGPLRGGTDWYVQAGLQPAARRGNALLNGCPPQHAHGGNAGNSWHVSAVADAIWNQGSRGSREPCVPRTFAASCVSRLGEHFAGEAMAARASCEAEAETSQS